MFNGVGCSYGDIGGGFSYGNRDADGNIGVGGVQSSGVYDSYGNDGSSDGGGLGGSDGGIDYGSGNGDSDGGGHNDVRIGETDKGAGGAGVENDSHIFGGKMTIILDSGDSDGGVRIKTA